MSEAELHQIRVRLHQGELQKAARGELRTPLPAGLVHERGGQITLNPDEEVQGRLRLVFAKFRELQSARAVMLYLRRNTLPLPVRPFWEPPRTSLSGAKRAPVRFSISCTTRLTPA
jgi:DNA invertase Pin-like site-specific DNA recombinase